MKNDLITTLFATKTEATPFINGLNLTKISSKPFIIFKNENLFLIISGIGKIKSALAVGFAKLKLNTNIIINFGACGALNSNFKQGEILNINKTINKSSGIITRIPEISQLKKSSILTVDQPVISRPDRIKDALHAPLVDMEGAGFAEACNLFNLNGFIIKIVSDSDNDTSTKTIIKNIKIFSKDLYNYCMEKKILTESNFVLFNR